MAAAWLNMAAKSLGRKQAYVAVSEVTDEPNMCMLRCRSLLAQRRPDGC
jgi:hypothetical protein